MHAPAIPNSGVRFRDADFKNRSEALASVPKIRPLALFVVRGRRIRAGIGGLGLVFFLAADPKERGMSHGDLYSTPRIEARRR